jgi:hypothetical protein
MSNFDWIGDFFPATGQAVFDRENQQLAAVSRAPGNLDLFVIGNDNHVWTTYWNESTGWNQDWFPLPGQAVFDRENQQLAAVSRAPGNLDLFVIGNDNHVWTTYWNESTGWNQDWFPLPGQAVFDRENQQLAAVSRAPGNLDLFVIGNDNHVWTTYWNESTGWNQDWFPLPGQAVFDRENQQLAAVSRAPGNLDLFVIGNDNHVWTTYWNESTGWNQDWFPLPGQAVFDRENQQLAAVSRAPGNLDLFVIGNDNHVWTTYWNEPIATFAGQISSGGLAALGGWFELTIFGNGGLRWRGHAHNSGADGYDFGVIAFLSDRNGHAIGTVHHGHVGGTFTAGSPDDDWDELHPIQPTIAEHFSHFAAGEFHTSTDYTSAFGSTAENALGIIAKFTFGSTPLGAALGIVVFVGAEVGSLISTGSLVPGARVVGGVLWLAGPSNTLLALAAEGIASLGSRTRELTPEEYRWADEQVFRGTLPARDHLVLTDTLGPGDRPFTIPRFDGAITPNMGPTAFDNPLQQGRTFIHELVHAWQIQHTPMELSLLAEALVNRVCEVTEGIDAVYTPGEAGPPFSNFNLEQQAKIVDNWFANGRLATDPYYRYILENIQTGQP